MLRAERHSTTEGYTVSDKDEQVDAQKDPEVVDGQTEETPEVEGHMIGGPGLETGRRHEPGIRSDTSE
ncbi:MAG: hypothetical protein QOD66_4175 [Solirubrobacteraceae bacterium]|jgi:hypothetical protein|nr:hypothetical protein [Solirubrobacteraceae bacterium]